jgi:hypothetical protein
MSIYLLFALFAAASAQTRTVGVSVGDTFKYSYSTRWSSNDPTATPSQSLIDLNESQLQVDITAISGTNITAKVTGFYKNGSETTEDGWVDVNTGEGNFTSFIISANLAAGDSIYSSSDYSAMIINETATKTYSSGVTRDTNYLNMSEPIMEGLSGQSDMYWDKSTGVLVEMSTKTVNQTSTCTTTSSLDAQIISSSVWTVPEFTNWTLAMVTLIALTSAITLIPRRKRTPTKF